MNYLRALLAANCAVAAFAVALAEVSAVPWLCAVTAAVAGGGAGSAWQCILDERRRT